jgi:nicotinate phosphoribosyltransferase
MNSALFTDYYELTMAQGYWKQGMDVPVVFDMFFRRHPFKGGFSIFAGLGTLLDALEGFAFGEDDLAYLEGLGVFEGGFLDYLRTFRFTGDLYALEEGTPIFPNEPLVRVHSTLIQAQVIEGLLLNHLNFQSLVATKTCRVWLASDKGRIMEFGLRRAQGPDGALSASRAAFIGGASSTSNTLAGRLLGIPVQGTMAHSWVMSFPTELDAFRTYAALYPRATVFLIDTYDTLHSGIKNALIAGGELVKAGHGFGIRLDSGDMQYLSTEVRRILDQGGFPQATITVSNDLTEEIIEALIRGGAPIDAWGVGTQMVTGGSEAAFTGVYKLASLKRGGAYEAVMKFSDNPDKMSSPGEKALWRLYGDDGLALADVVALEGEDVRAGEMQPLFHPAVDYRQVCLRPAVVESLLKPFLRDGRRVTVKSSGGAEIRSARIRMEGELCHFDATYKRFLNPHVYKVSLSRGLKDLKLRFIQEHITR